MRRRSEDGLMVRGERREEVVRRAEQHSMRGRELTVPLLLHPSWSFLLLLLENRVAANQPYWAPMNSLPVNVQLLSFVPLPSSMHIYPFFPSPASSPPLHLSFLSSLHPSFLLPLLREYMQMNTYCVCTTFSNRERTKCCLSL